MTSKAGPTLTTTEMVQVLGISKQRLSQLVHAGVVTPIKRGKYDAADTVQRYLAHRLDGVEKKRGAAKEDPLKVARTREVELRTMKMEREVVTLAEAMAAIDLVVGRFVASLDVLPAKITKNRDERERISGVFDNERSRLAKRFAVCCCFFGTDRSDARI